MGTCDGLCFCRKKWTRPRTNARIIDIVHRRRRSFFAIACFFSFAVFSLQRLRDHAGSLVFSRAWLSLDSAVPATTKTKHDLNQTQQNLTFQFRHFNLSSSSLFKPQPQQKKQASPNSTAGSPSATRSSTSPCWARTSPRSMPFI